MIEQEQEVVYYKLELPQKIVDGLNDFEQVILNGYIYDRSLLEINTISEEFKNKFTIINPSLNQYFKRVIDKSLLAQHKELIELTNSLGMTNYRTLIKAILDGTEYTFIRYTDNVLCLIDEECIKPLGNLEEFLLDKCKHNLSFKEVRSKYNVETISKYYFYNPSFKEHSGAGNLTKWLSKNEIEETIQLNPNLVYVELNKSLRLLQD